MIYQTAYDTTIGKMLNINPLNKAIQTAFITDALFNESLDLTTQFTIKPIFIKGKTVSQDRIPFFSHPYLLKIDDKSFMVTDIRPYISVDTHTHDFRVKNTAEFNFIIARTVLSMGWILDMQSNINNELSYAGVVYSKWISNVVGKRYALDQKDLIVVEIVSYFFYLSLFLDKITEEDVQKMAVKIGKSTKAPMNMIFDAADKCTFLGNNAKVTDLDSFSESIKLACENIRLDEFNKGVLLTIIGNSWYGANSREIVPISLEHPPTWCAIVFAALTEKSFKNLLISRITEKYAKYGNGDNFLLSMKSILEQFKNYNVSKEMYEELDIRPFDDSDLVRG